MREESQLDDMRAAIRGDFERLAERRGDQMLMGSAEERAPETEDSEPSPIDAPKESRRSWLSRLVSP